MATQTAKAERRVQLESLAKAGFLTRSQAVELANMKGTK